MNSWSWNISLVFLIVISHVTFHNQVLSHQVSDDHMPDVNLIGEMGDVTELGKLVQLVLGCAVSCEKKQGKASTVRWGKKGKALVSL